MRICFYPAHSGKVWNGSSLYSEALGGSETAVIYVAKELAKRGHEVIVFTRSDPEERDGVAYLPFSRAKNILRTLPLDALVCSRDPMPLIWPRRAAVTALWSHDLPAYKPPEADFYAFVSMWQANQYVGNGLVPLERSRVLPNGVDLALFHQKAAIREFSRNSTIKFAWTSNPERGLWHAAEVVRRVREQYPNAELHVFGRNDVYGWNSSTEHVFYPDDMTGVILHKPLTKSKLANALVGMDMWVYPTWWPETYCIAAVEAQAAGVPVVASSFGALTETAQKGRLVTGSMRDGQSHLDLVVGNVLDLLETPAERRKLQAEGLTYATTQSWESAAMRWEKLLTTSMGIAA